MSGINDGGPAFPSEGEGFGDPRYSTPGMTLRDWFAGQTFASIMTTAHGMGAASKEERAAILKQAAELCYEGADAMLEARKK